MQTLVDSLTGVHIVLYSNVHQLYATVRKTVLRVGYLYSANISFSLISHHNSGVGSVALRTRPEYVSLQCLLNDTSRGSILSTSYSVSRFKRGKQWTSGPVMKFVARGDKEVFKIFHLHRKFRVACMKLSSLR